MGSYEHSILRMRVFSSVSSVMRIERKVCLPYHRCPYELKRRNTKSFKKVNVSIITSSLSVSRYSQQSLCYERSPRPQLSLHAKDAASHLLLLLSCVLMTMVCSEIRLPKNSLAHWSGGWSWPENTTIQVPLPENTRGRSHELQISLFCPQ